ncbi:SulP family inorganic anion transporter [Desulfobotulus sp. H1]|uniref:SulP family inorganic anion transporter n=1 Tax=Desulfobotulus pelophilus TaxID=2823377 RepID=A0ABT3N961_9BACT|nr:SulP family inorganic anion transporter [Desulfobotulus pelophilus]MCW7754003.1 SulP family inorganic anion transporter [Desulfobotulus pelophilus]
MTAKFSSLSVRGDLFGGLTAGIVALPLALAFGVASGAGAAAGLYGAIVLGLLAALAGGTRMQISGPTGPMTVVFAAILISMEGNLAMVMGAVFVCGMVQILLGLSRAGALVRFIPYPVVSGFMSGIGLIIILLQLAPLLGAPSQSSPTGALLALPQTLMQMNFQAAFLSLLTLLIVFLTPMRISRILPSPLVALIVVTLVSMAAGFRVPVIGEIPMGLPDVVFPVFSWETIKPVVLAGITLALLGSIDSLLTSLVADSVTGTRHNSNRELVGQGLGNSLCAFVGGLPGAGATMRTVVNIKAGGSTRLSGVTHAVFLLVLLMGAAPLAQNIPLAVLAGILVKVGLDILDYRFIKLLKTAPRDDLMVMTVVFVLTVFVDLIIAVGVGVLFSMALITKRVSSQARVSLWPEDESATSRMQGEVRVLEIQGAFFFGSTSRLTDNVDQVLGTRVIIFNCSRIPFIDLSAVFALEETIERLKASRITSLVVMPPKIRAQLIALNHAGLPSQILFPDLKSALMEAENFTKPEKTKKALVPGAKILLVDDEKDFTEMLSLRLEERGHRVWVAHDGMEGLNLLREQPQDVVVLDLRMPGMGGLEVLAQMKKEFPFVEVILLTGHGSEESAVHGMRMGAFDYLMKPAEFSQLLDKIKAARRRKVAQEDRIRQAEMLLSLPSAVRPLNEEEETEEVRAVR